MKDKLQLSGTNNCTGGIIGRVIGDNSTTNFSNISNSGEINGTNAGGCIGWLDGNVYVNNSSNSGKIDGVTIGGCIGWGNGFTNVNNFSNTGNLSATSAAGGCMGTSRNKAILTNIVNKCEKTESTSGAGGIIAYSGLTQDTKLIIFNSYNTSQVISIEKREAGGIVADTDSVNYLINVYNTGDCLTNLEVGNNIVEGSSGGIVGSSFVNGATFNIINVYNTGNITSNINNKFSSGILGCKNLNFTNSYIKNVYNVGTLTGSNTNGIVGFNPSSNVSLSPSQSENVFYLDKTDKGTNATNDIFTKYTEDQIKSESFVQTLNKYVEKNPVFKVENLSIPLLKWKLGEKGYPVFE